MRTMSAASVQRHVLDALLMREMVLRYGRQNLGFAWLVVEPMILTCGVLVLWSFIHHDQHGVTVIAFVFTGYMPLTLWRHVSGYTVSCLRQNAALLYYAPVRPLDTLFGRILLEFAGTSFAFLAVYLMLRLAGILDPIADWGLVLAGWLLMAWFAAGVGLVFAALAERWDAVEKLVPALQYLLLPISGVFFMVAWLPSSVARMALWVPMVNCYEMVRAGALGAKVETQYDMGYVIVVCIITSALGWSLARRAADHLEFE